MSDESGDKAMSSKETEEIDAITITADDAGNQVKKVKKKRKSKPFGWRDKKKKKNVNNGEKKERVKNYRKDNSDEEQIPHGGSYAHPDMKEISLLTKVPDMEDTLVESDVNSETSSQGKFPKRKVAILLGFKGSNYSGMAMNIGMRTIQAELEQAMYRAGCISKSNYGFPSKYSWSNSARTDKGVHSCAQVCSGKVLMIDEDWDVVRTEINNFLPSDIRVLDIVKTNRKFVARTYRDKVRYMYLLPSFILRDRNELRDIFTKQGCPDNGRFARDPLSETELAAIRPQLLNYRINKNQMELLRIALRSMEGTRYFRKCIPSPMIRKSKISNKSSNTFTDNYTNGKSWTDKAAQRYIIRFEALEPVIDENGVEWIPTQITGQSFLLHQIRKMVCMASEVARGAANLSVIEDSFSQRKMQTSIAPAQGLFLDMSFFEQYNNDKRHNVESPILWHEIEDTSNTAAQGIQKFKEMTLMKHIMKEEYNEGNFIKYIFVQEFKFDADEAYAPLITNDTS